MPNELTTANILDLTSQQTVFELAIEDQELIGPSGAKLIADIKERAAEADYTHMYFRDPIRPGIVWFTALGPGSGLNLPTRGRLDQCRRVAESVFPDFLEQLEKVVAAAEESEDQDPELVVISQIPPISRGVSGLELATALEYIVFVYPSMVRAWAALIFTYDQIIGLRSGVDSARNACMANCQHAQLVPYLTGDEWENDAVEAV
jgi:hypothetical protein